MSVEHTSPSTDIRVSPAALAVLGQVTPDSDVVRASSATIAALMRLGLVYAPNYRYGGGGSSSARISGDGRDRVVCERYRENAGWRRTCVPPTTGLPVSVYDGGPAGMDVEGGRWQTVCEPHGSVISHTTKVTAIDWAESPELWCACCMGDHTEACAADVCNPDLRNRPATG